jgi:beta-glucosidase
MFCKVKVIVFAGQLLLALFVFGQKVETYEYAFQNPNLPTEQRITNLLSLMTLDEKIQCLSTDPSVPRLGVKGSGHVEGLHGLAQGGPARWGRKNPIPTTTFPQAYGLGESWDIEAIKRVAEIEAEECRYLFQNPEYKRAGLVVRAPNADLGRDPRWGRTEECYGEDAWFNGTMTVAFIKGLQGDDPKYWKTAALMKHFIANSNEHGRDSSSSNFDDRLLHEYYTKPFRMGVEDGGSRAFMASYNSVNGIPMTVNPMLLSLAKEKWGQDGIICTDGGAFRLLLDAHKYYPDPYKGAAAVIKAGINQFLDDYKLGVYGALANGYLTESDIEQVIRGNFRVMIKLGMLDNPDLVPYSKIGLDGSIEPWKREANKTAVREVTRKTIVLLKNEKQTLPILEEQLTSVAVIGSVANEVFLDWYSGDTAYAITPLEGIKSRLGDNTQIAYSNGTNIDEAQRLAQKSDWVILVVGNHPHCGTTNWLECNTPSFGREGVDRQSLTLEEEALIKKVYEKNKKVVVVLVSSFPYAINWTQANIPAIVHMTHNSQEMGNALADVLFGDFNPAGRLTQTWPASLSQLPDMMDYDIRNGRTYMYSKQPPLYPFGFGLSYTSFKYSQLVLNKSIFQKGDEIMATVNIENTGKYDGDEVVQLYVRYVNSKVERPQLELHGFDRVFIKKGETKTVSIRLNASDLAYWSVKENAFVVESGKIEITVGASSKDLRLSRMLSIVD